MRTAVGRGAGASIVRRAAVAGALVIMACDSHTAPPAPAPPPSAVAPTPTPAPPRPRPPELAELTLKVLGMT